MAVVAAAVTARSPSPASASGASAGWLWPLIGTAASIAFASAFSLTLRILRGLSASRTAALQPPQAILVLGGNRYRERLAGRFAALLASPSTGSLSCISSSSSSDGRNTGVTQDKSTGRRDIASSNGSGSSSGDAGSSAAAACLAFDPIFTSSPKPLANGTLDLLPPAHAAASGKLPVFISSGNDDAADVMMREGVAAGRLRVDNHALDTVTNFTEMLRTFQRLKITHVLVVTSDYHMPRAAMMAKIVLQTHGIAFSTVTLPSRPEICKKGKAGAAVVKDGVSGISGAGTGVKGGGEEEEEVEEEVIEEIEEESKLRLERDRLRGFFWLVTGWHGAEFLRFTRPERYRLHKQKPLVVCPV